MAEQNELDIGIGNKEAITLKPTMVAIVGVEVVELGKTGTTKKGKKVICISKHPDQPDTIKISSVKYENKGKLEVAGLWMNLDSDGLIKKNSALAIFLNTLGAKNLQDLKNKTVSTIQDDKGYLVFKAY